MGKTIGIDLGTTNSCVAVMEGEAPAVIANAEGYRTTPSVVAFSKKGEIIVGDAAKRQSAVNVSRTITSIKREMGTDYSMTIDGMELTPQKISAMILKKLKEDAESYLGQKVTDAVITVPAYFTDAQRQATKDAGAIAGLTVKRIINEPTAAALAYGLDNGKEQKILVYDLGGGTFDVSVIEIGEGLIEVLATAGDNRLGGDDFDQRLVDFLVEGFKKQEKVNLTKDLSAMERLREAAENAKKELSTAMSANVNLPFICTVKGEPKHLDLTITRQQFNEMTFDLVERTITPVENALKDAGISVGDLAMVLLVGGSTRIPAVQERIEKLTGKAPSKNINPDECVAMGAAIQGGKIGGELVVGSAAADIILMDVTPLSLSIETVGGVANRIIERNSTIPCRQSKIFTTAAAFQTAVDIKVYQGERKFVRDNKMLGEFRLTGIKRAMSGVPQIEVTFDIDVNGIVHVSAKDLGTGKAQEITITSGGNLSEEEIARARAEAEAYEANDNAKVELIDIYNAGQAMISQVEPELKANKKQWDKKAYTQVKGDLNILKKSVQTTKIDKITDQQAGQIKVAMEQLNQSLSNCR